MKSILKTLSPLLFVLMLGSFSMSVFAGVPTQPPVDLSGIVGDSSTLKPDTLMSKGLGWGGMALSGGLILLAIVMFAYESLKLMKRVMNDRDELQFADAIGNIIFMLVIVAVVVTLMGFLFKYSNSLI